LENVSQQKYDKQAYFSNEYAQKEINRCYRVIVDHVKSCVFAISDGAIISNKERGAILRRLIRRSIIASRKIGSSKDFLPIVVDEIVTQYKDFYPYLTSTRQNVIQALESERKLFEETIDKGYALFNDEINSKNELSGEVIFKLVSTYGFPIELIEELCKENNIKLNKEEYFNKFTQHQEISRAHVVRTGMSEQVDSLINFKEPSNFLYDQLELQNVKITGIFDEKYNLVNSIHGKLWLAFHQTVFYATSGGQIHDKGSISVNGNKYAVLDVVKAPNGQHLHLIDALDRQITTNEPCDLKVDPIFRTNVSRNHTAEHILEHVMNKNIDTSIKQEGAFKTDTYFTFDFKLNYKLSSEQLKLIENKVNEIINNENEINVILKSHDELANANVVGHFTEKYKSIKGDLRVVCIKGVNDEICGGTHVNNTKDLEKFMIVEYTPKGTGFWRIRGITSNNTTSKYIDEQIEIIELQINKIKAKVNELKIDNKLLNELINEINYHSSTKNLIELEKQLNKIKEISDEEFKKSAKLNEGNIIAEIKATDKMFSSSGVICYFSVHDKPIKLIAFALNELSNEDSKYLYVVLNILNDKIQYCLIANSKDIAIKPNEFIKKINLICDGSGGGNELFAQGGTNKVEKTVELLDFIKSN
jgi:alanyl-tRNA synthetase